MTFDRLSGFDRSWFDRLAATAVPRMVTVVITKRLIRVTNMSERVDVTITTRPVTVTATDRVSQTVTERAVTVLIYRHEVTVVNQS